MPLMPMPPIPVKCKCCCEKTFLYVLFRLAGRMSMKIVCSQSASPPPLKCRPLYRRRRVWRIAARPAPIRFQRADSAAAGESRPSNKFLAGHFGIAHQPGGAAALHGLGIAQSDDRRRRTETGPESTAFPRPPVPKPYPRRSGRRSDRPAAKAAGMSAMKGTISPSRPACANCSRSARRPTRRFDGRCAPAAPDLRNSGQLCRAAWFRVREPWLPPVISTCRAAARALGANARKTLRAPAGRSTSVRPPENSGRSPETRSGRARRSGRLRDW